MKKIIVLDEVMVDCYFVQGFLCAGADWPA